VEPRPSLRRDLILLSLTALLLFLPGLGARDLWNPNEPTYGLAVAEMAQHGEWLIPTVNGERFVEKPILYFWLGRIATIAAGLNEFALRLPSILAALVSVAYVFLLGNRLASRFCGMAAALMFATSVSIATSARMIQMDLLATACVVATVYHGLIALERPGIRSPWLATGLAAGIGFLAKGPVVWICAAIPLGAAIAIAGERPRLPLRSVALALAAMAAPVAAWIVPLAATGELGVLRETILRQNFARFVDPWDHAQSWWYYLKYLWIELAPWSLLLPLAVGAGPTGQADRKLYRIAWIWLIGTVVFFSLSGSKRAVYLMPAAPAVALLVAGLAERLFRGTLDATRRRILGGALVAVSVSMLGAAWAVYGLRERYPSNGTALTVAAIALCLGAGVLLVTLVLEGRQRRAAIGFMIVLAALECGSLGWLAPRADEFKSARGFAGEVAAVSRGDAISGYRLWIWRADYHYYLGRRIGRVETPGALKPIWVGPARVCLIVEESKRQEFLATTGPALPQVSRAVGSKQVELYCNR